MVTSQMEAEAKERMFTAAHNGDRGAQFIVGLFHHRVEGPKDPQNYDLAEEWYVRSAKQGYTTAMFNMGIVCAIREKMSDAYMWFNLASLRGFNSAYVLLDEIESVEGVDSQIVIDGRRKSREWLNKNKSTLAPYNCYSDDESCRKDYGLPKIKRGWFTGKKDSWF